MTCTASGKKKKLSRQVILCAKAKNGENILCFCAHTRCILTKRVFLLFLCFELFKSISRLRRRWVRRRRRQEERSDRRLPDRGGRRPGRAALDRRPLERLLARAGRRRGRGGQARCSGPVVVARRFGQEVPGRGPADPDEVSLSFLREVSEREASAKNL